MKKIAIPNTIVLVDPSTGADVRPLSFHDWMKTAILVDAHWGKSAKMIMMAADLARRFTDASEVVELSDNEYQEVRLVVETPSSGYNVPVATQIIPFFEAVLYPVSD